MIWIIIFSYLIIGGLCLLFSGLVTFVGGAFRVFPKLVVYAFAPVVFVAAFVMLPYKVFNRLKKEKPKNAKIILTCGIVIDISMLAIIFIGITL
ncbi:MAG: hypothetical protein LBO06_02450 [Bacteroidales bacterium]|nr:hypothetical protein [Bacteroidales bacterium]